MTRRIGSRSSWGCLLVAVLLGLLVTAQPARAEAETPVEEDAGLEDPFADTFEEEAPPVYDPLEPMNRGLFWVNDKLYVFILKPVARVYRFVPERVRVSVSNAFSNITAPVRMVNALLQFRGETFWNELARFEINTTAGLGGLFDPARNVFSLEPRDEDFGQTLGHHGTPGGPYLFLPFLGPSNFRDAAGTGVDAFLNPITYLTWHWTFMEKAGLRTGQGINALSLDKDTYEAIKRDSLDPYLFIRNAYAQHREGYIRK